MWLTLTGPSFPPTVSEVSSNWLRKCHVMHILGDASAMQVVVINVLPYTRYETCVITLSSKQSNEAVTQLHFETFKEFSGTHDSASDAYVQQTPFWICHH